MPALGIELMLRNADRRSDRSTECAETVRLRTSTGERAHGASTVQIASARQACLGHYLLPQDRFLSDIPRDRLSVRRHRIHYHELHEPRFETLPPAGVRHHRAGSLRPRGLLLRRLVLHVQVQRDGRISEAEHCAR